MPWGAEAVLGADGGGFLSNLKDRKGRKAGVAKVVSHEEKRKKRRVLKKKKSDALQVVAARGLESESEASSRATSATDTDTAAGTRNALSRKVFRKKKRKHSVVDEIAKPLPNQPKGQAKGKGKKGAQASEDTAPQPRVVPKADQLLLKRTLLNRSHKAPLPYERAPDFEKKLKTVATKGVVRLFNAVSAATKPLDKPAAPASTGASLLAGLVSSKPDQKVDPEQLPDST
eukprot:gene1082-2642_t